MKTYRPAISAVALISLFALTGAKAEGCGGSVEIDPAPGPCGPSAHLEDICLMECYESSEPGGTGGCTETCEPTCVPDDDCPPGTVAELICDEPLSSDSSGAPCLGGEDCAEPLPEDCRTECVPVGECGPGYEEQWVCGGESVSGPGDEPVPPPGDCFDSDCAEPPGPEDCWLECVPVDTCGPGFHEEWVCDPMPAPSDSADEPAPPPEDCYSACVPDLCPPDVPVIEVCTIDEYGELICWTECADPELPDSAS